MQFTDNFLKSKHFKKVKDFKGYPTYRLGIMDVAYYLVYMGWRGNYSLYIEYTDPITDSIVGELFSFGTVDTKEDLESFFNIMSYKEQYEKYFEHE